MLPDIEASLPDTAKRYLDLLGPEVDARLAADQAQEGQGAEACYSRMLTWLLENRAWLWPLNAERPALCQGILPLAAG